MNLLIQCNEACILALIPSNEDPYKVVSRKVVFDPSYYT